MSSSTAATADVTSPLAHQACPASGTVPTPGLEGFDRDRAELLGGSRHSLEAGRDEDVVPLHFPLARRIGQLRFRDDRGLDLVASCDDQDVMHARSGCGTTKTPASLAVNPFAFFPQIRYALNHYGRHGKGIRAAGS